MAKPKHTSTSMLARAREFLLENEPHSAGDLARAIGYAPGTLGRILSLFGEEQGLIRSRLWESGGQKVVWSADPNWRPLPTTPGPSSPGLSLQQQQERESQERLAEMLRRFRQEPPRYAGGRRHA